jgi:hypothetical protein
VPVRHPEERPAIEQGVAHRPPTERSHDSECVRADEIHAFLRGDDDPAERGENDRADLYRAKAGGRADLDDIL